VKGSFAVGERVKIVGVGNTAHVIIGVIPSDGDGDHGHGVHGGVSEGRPPRQLAVQCVTHDYFFVKISCSALFALLFLGWRVWWLKVGLFISNNHSDRREFQLSTELCK